MVKMKCTGWWEQQGYGRQAMEGLELSFNAGNVRGAGIDMIGEFVFSGVIDGEQIHLRKQYIGQHHIEYHGTYDGEGVYYGRWNYGGYLGGNWLIRVGANRSPQASAEDEITELWCSAE